MPIPSIAPRPTDEPPSGLGTPQGAHRVVQVLMGLLALTLASLAIVLYVAGARHNSQIESLRQRGIRVDATVTSCIGNLGGSGSNAVGATCTGTYTVNGRRYTAQLPGSAVLSPGDKEPIITTKSDPGLLDSPSNVATEHSSGSVYILPSVFAGLLVALVAIVGLRARSSRHQPAN